MGSLTVSIGSNSPVWWPVATTLLGAIVGAVSSGAVSIFTENKKRAAANRDRDRTVGLEIVVKAKLLADEAFTLHNQIEGTIREAEKAGITGATWQKLSGIVHDGGLAVRLSAEELGFFIRAKESSVGNEFVLQTQRVKAVVAGSSAYFSLRDKLAEVMPAQINGRVGATVVTAEEAEKLAPRIANLTTLADSVREGSREAHLATIKVAKEVGRVVRAFLNDPTFPAPFPIVQPESAKQDTK